MSNEDLDLLWGMSRNSMLLALLPSGSFLVEKLNLISIFVNFLLLLLFDLSLRALVY